MNETRFQQLLESARVRVLTAAEEADLRAWFAAHPAARAVWEEDRRLDALLRGLPDLPVASNFTAQVLAAVERDARTAPAPAAPWWSRWFAGPRLAIAATVLALAALGAWQWRLERRAQLAASVEALAGVAAVPTLEMLADFDAIVRLGALPPNTDRGVLTALQTP